jgi:hypothetical protein
VIGLVHQTLVILDLVIKLLLDVVLHFMRDETTCDFIGNLAQQCEIIRCEVLIVFLVGDLKDSNRVIAKFYWNKKHIADNLMQLLVHSHVIPKFLPDILILGSFEMSSLPCIEDLAQHILTITFEADRLSQPACDYFAEKGVFDSIVQEN